MARYTYLWVRSNIASLQDNLKTCVKIYLSLSLPTCMYLHAYMMDESHLMEEGGVFVNCVVVPMKSSESVHGSNRLCHQQ